MKFELNELIALTNYYFEDMKKNGFVFLDDVISDIRIVDNTNCCAFTSFSNTNYSKDTSKVYISFNKYYIEEVELHALRNTIVHELCHCLKGTLKEIHGKNWKAWAKKANALYNLEISTYANNEECIGIFKHNKYTITCPKCGIIWGYDRLTAQRKRQYRNKKRRCNKCDSVVDYVQNR